MKTWVKKLIDQLDYDWKEGGPKEDDKGKTKLSEDRASLLYIIDVYTKHLIDIEGFSLRKVREDFDCFSHDLITATKKNEEEVLFKFRQFFSNYKAAEYAFLRKSFEDFKVIVWNFVEQLGEDAVGEQHSDKVMGACMRELRDAVEADSLPLLRQRAKHFIDVYKEQQLRREERRSKRVRGIKKNLDVVKRQLVEADKTIRLDHLTNAYNRRSFDEAMKEHLQLFLLTHVPVSLITIDIDFFKKFNDSYGHDIGDFILKECVKLLQNVFSKEGEFVARIGGEEFTVILPNHAVEHATKRAEMALARIRKEVFVDKGMEFRFTVSMGIAQLLEGETAEQWLKRGDQALYASKQGGRNRFTVATPHGEIMQVVA